MKKIINFGIMLCMVMVLIVPLTVSFASENQDDSTFTREDFAKLQEQDAVGEDVTYEDLLKINEDAKKLEETLSNDPTVTKLNVYASSFTPRAGDILISTRTSSAGLTGHAAIATSSTQVLHIAGFNKPVTTPSYSTFANDWGGNGQLSVYRLNSSTAASKAATWAVNKYKGSSAVYKITTNLTTTHETYCSKIVFQAYYYGVGRSVVNDKFTLTGIVAPYTLPSLLNGGSYSCTKVASY